MRWKSPRGSYDNIESSHDWFAWYPVRLHSPLTGEARTKRAWLERVRRRGRPHVDTLSHKTYWTFKHHLKSWED